NKTTAPVNVPVEQTDATSFQVRFQNITSAIDFVFEFTDTDDVKNKRRIIIKPVDDQAPDVDVSIEVIRRTNQGYIVTPLARIPFSGKVRDDNGFGEVDYGYTILKLEPEANTRMGAVLAAGVIGPRMGG